VPCVIEISRYGWSGYIYPNDHNPPHLHIKLNKKILFKIEISGGYEILEFYERKTIKTPAIKYLQDILKRHSQELLTIWDERQDGSVKHPVIKA